ncbi:MAG: PAS domain-containing protein [Chloroflexi bacterium]|nr:MAG: PAS domain-containing protein [Chloroflexota bacterium]
MLPWIIAGLALIALVVLTRMVFQSRTRLRAVELEQTRLRESLIAQIKQAEQLRDDLFRVVDDALLVMDARQVITFANDAAEMLLGENPVGRTLIQAIPQPELVMLFQDAQLVRGEGVDQRIELDKHIFHARMVASANEQHPFEILVLRDVTQIQRLERARREMVSNITHELNTPITAIGLLADTLLNLTEQGKTKKTRKMAHDIRREVDTLTQLVQEMQDLSLIESGQMPVRLMPTDLREMVQRSVEPLLALAENKHQTVSIDVPPDVLVLADERTIGRAIKNIVHNAVKYTPPGGQVQVTATTAADEAIVSVRDDGPGIPAPDLSRIFERFYQVDRARREGTGLGLAIVRHIVMAHGGRAWAESVEGQGATFFISLALADTPIPVPARDRPALQAPGYSP